MVPLYQSNEKGVKMDIKWEKAVKYQNELLIKLFGTKEENEILKKLTSSSCIQFFSQDLFNLYNYLSNFARFTNTTFSFSSCISLKQLDSIKNIYYKTASEKLISLIEVFCQSNGIDYSYEGGLLVIDEITYSADGYILNNIFDIVDVLSRRVENKSLLY